MQTFIHRFRPVNLMIVAFTQLFFLHVITLPFLVKNGIQASPLHHYYLIVLTTLIICAGGYIINDIMDVDIDAINKPSNVIKNVALWEKIYKFLFVLGLLICVYFSVPEKHPFFIAIYLLAWSLLNAYSKKLKCMPLIGNLVVALFSALVISAVLGLQFGKIIALSSSELESLFRPFSFYFIFAFLISLIREIVKDLQDQQGDRKQDCRTLVVEAGEARTQIFTAFFMICLLVSLLMWQSVFWKFYPIWGILGLNLTVTLPLIYCIYLVTKKPFADVGQAQRHYGKISKILKVMMFAGILFLVLELMN